MWLDTAVDMNEILIKVLGDDSEANWFRLWENVSYELSDCENESLHILTVPTFSEEFATSMIADEDPVDNIPKNPTPCGRSHGCAHCAADRTYSCT